MSVAEERASIRCQRRGHTHIHTYTYVRTYVRTYVCVYTKKSTGTYTRQKTKGLGGYQYAYTGARWVSVCLHTRVHCLVNSREP